MQKVEKFIKIQALQPKPQRKVMITASNYEDDDDHSSNNKHKIGMVNAWEQMIQPTLKTEPTNAISEDLENQKIEKKETPTEIYNVTSDRSLNHKIQPKYQPTRNDLQDFFPRKHYQPKRQNQRDEPRYKPKY